MNRTKSILLAATALATLGVAQQASAQTAPGGAAVVFLPGASNGTADCPLVADVGSESYAISGDGRFVVGAANSACLVAWRDGAPQVLDDRSPLARNGGGIEYATGMSADGSVIVGSRNISSNLASRAPTLIWTATTGSYLPPEPIVGSRRAVGGGYVNSDGTIFALNTLDFTFSTSRGENINSGLGYVYRWSATGGFQEIGRVDASFSMFARGIDGSGNAIVGVAENPSTFNDPFGSETRAFVWRTGSGLTTLPDLSSSPPVGTNRYSEANGISRDGTTIIGQSRGADGRVQGVYWRGGVITGLGWLPGASPADGGYSATNVTQALAANSTGDIIVGKAIGLTTDLAWRWTATSGIQDLNLFAANAGINLGGFVLTDAVGLSDNGQVITGNSFNAMQSRSLGYVLSIAAAPPVPDPVLGVAFLPPISAGTASCSLNSSTNTFAQTISADGQTIVGQANSDCLAVWRNAVPGVLDDSSQLQINGSGINLATGMSADSSVIVGTESSFPTRTVIWTAATGSYLPPEPVPGQRAAFGEGNVSSDGTIFALNTLAYTILAGGQTINATSAPARVYRWSAANGFEDIGTLGTQYRMIAHGISGAGSTIVGTAVIDSTITAPLGQESAAFVWRSGSGLAALPQLVAPPQGAPYLPYAEANGISRDGSTIVGASRGVNGLVQATFWRAGTATGLGFLSGLTPASADAYAINTTRALAANADGSVIVGTTFGVESGTAWRWTAANGMQDLNLVARNAGLDLGSFVLTDAVGLSDNGEFVTGNSTDGTQFRGYVFGITRVAPPPTPTTFETTSRLIVTLRLPGVTQTSIVNQSFSTQVNATLNGTNVFTRSFGAAIDSTAGTTALTDARTALQQGAGLRRVTIGTPTMVSNVTTVLRTTSTTTDVPSGTQVTTASVTTPGAATVATGDLGTCATPAATNINPTGCSLPGTTVAVGSNEININNFINTIASVTPTTMTTVDQLITARWQVAATSGNQFGTVHALVGSAAFERSDRLIAQLIAMGGDVGDDRANGVTRAATPMRSARGFGEGNSNGLTMFGGYFNNRSRIDADASVPVARVRGSTDGFVIGLEQSLGDDAHIGVAVDHGTSDIAVRDPLYAETLTLKQTQVAAFAGWASNGFSLDAAGSYGFGKVRTGIATPGGAANARRDSSSWSLGAQAGYTLELGDDASVALVTGVRHVSARLDGFTETGGSSPLIGIASRVDRTRLYAGIEAEARIDLGGLAITPRLHARAARDSGDASGTADLVFASTPNAAPLQAVGPGVGRTVAELGGSVEMAVGSDVTLWAGYDAQLRDGARSNTAKIGVSVQF